jgi:hypothetical protein
LHRRRPSLPARFATGCTGVASPSARQCRRTGCPPMIARRYLTSRRVNLRHYLRPCGNRVLTLAYRLNLHRHGDGSSRFSTPEDSRVGTGAKDPKSPHYSPYHLIRDPEQGLEATRPPSALLPYTAVIGHISALHIAGAYLLRYAQEASWREDNRRLRNGEQSSRIAGLAMISKRSVDFCGYWQRHLVG